MFQDTKTKESNKSIILRKLLYNAAFNRNLKYHARRFLFYFIGYGCLDEFIFMTWAEMASNMKIPSSKNMHNCLKALYGSNYIVKKRGITKVMSYKVQDPMGNEEAPGILILNDPEKAEDDYIHLKQLLYKASINQELTAECCRVLAYYSSIASFAEITVFPPMKQVHNILECSLSALRQAIDLLKDYELIMSEEGQVQHKILLRTQ